MSDTYTSLADLVKINDKNAVDLGATNIFNDAPLLRVLAAGPSSNGSTHKWVLETAASAVGFRAVNAGLANTTGSDSLESIDLKILDGSFAVDKALAKAYRQGVEAYIGREANRKLRAVMFEGEKQVLNGTGNKADGFLGFADQKSYLSTTCLNAGGSTALSSVYFIRTNDDGTDVQVVMDNDGNIEIGESIEQRLDTTDDPPKHYTGFYTSILGWMGVQFGGTYSVVRMANFAASGHTVTDDVLYQGLAVFPSSRQPNYIVMNRRGQNQLRDSRTATNATGVPAPRPTDIEGIPIIVSDALSNDESVVTAS